MQRRLENPRLQRQWPQHLGTVLWCAFLAACVATLLFFAHFDPLLLVSETAAPGWLADRRGGYALGFFFFWAIGTLAAGMTAWLITTPGRNDRE